MVVDKANTLRLNFKSNLLKVVGPAASAGKNKGGPVLAPGGVGGSLGTVPRMQIPAPL